MVGVAIEVGVDPASLARWHPGDFVYKKGILGICPGRKNSGHPSFCPTGEVNVAFGIALTGDPIHNCKAEEFGAQILTVPTSVDEFRTINSIIRNYYALNTRLTESPDSRGSSPNETGVGSAVTTESKVETLNEKRKAELRSSIANIRDEEDQDLLTMERHLRSFVKLLPGLVAKQAIEEGDLDFEGMFKDAADFWEEDDECFMILQMCVELFNKQRRTPTKEQVSAKPQGSSNYNAVYDTDLVEHHMRIFVRKLPDLIAKKAIMEGDWDFVRMVQEFARFWEDDDADYLKLRECVEILKKQSQSPNGEASSERTTRFF